MAKRKPTEKMIAFAQAIADELELVEPDFDDYAATSEFISLFKDDYEWSKSFRSDRK